MNPVVQILGLSLLAGLSMAAGGLLARLDRIQPRWLERELRHTITAFGGGALLSALALVLVPEGIAHLSIVSVSITFLAGAVTFLLVDRQLARHGGPKAQLAAMLLDFVPESIALGATFSFDPAKARLLAFLIALQNLPEGFNAYREVLSNQSMKPAAVLRFFLLLGLLGPLSAGLGLVVFTDRPVLLGLVMVFSAGGLLYLIFQDIAPQVPLGNHRAPALGAVAGFLLGLIGQMLAA